MQKRDSAQSQGPEPPALLHGLSLDPLSETISRFDWVPPKAIETLARDHASAQTRGRRPPTLVEVLVRDGHFTKERLNAALATSTAFNQPTADDDAVDELAPAGSMIGKYRVEREVGRGGMGVIYEATDTTLDRRVAIKLMRSIEVGKEMLARFRREGSLAARLSHRNIIAVHEIGVSLLYERLVHYISMELIEGRDLATAMEDLPLADRLDVLEQVARGVGFAHQHGIIHRDLKPANILIDAERRAVVTDFGLARTTSGEMSLTQTGAVLGTAPYMAPEQVEGRAANFGPHTDVWSLGVILYEMLTERLPFDGGYAAEVFRQILEEDPPSPRIFAHSLDPDLEAICLHALEKRPEDRYPDATALADDLARFRLGETVVARRPSQLLRLSRLITRRRATIASVALGLLVTLATSLSVMNATLRKSNAHMVMSEVQVQVGDRIGALLEPAQVCLRQLEVGIKRGTLSADRAPFRNESIEDDLLAQQLLDQLSIWESFAWITVSTPSGDFVGAMRVEEDERLRLAKSWFEGEKVRDRRYILEGDKLVLAPEQEPESYDYDPRTRPFYEMATSSDGIVFTPPYVFWGAYPGITCTTAVRDEAGAVIAVLTADFEVWQLSKELRRVTVGQNRVPFNGRISILSADGGIVAHTHDEIALLGGPAPKESKSQRGLVHYTEIKSPLLSSFLAAVDNEPERLIEVEHQRPLCFTHEGADYWAMLGKVDVAGLDLRWMAVVPDAEIDPLRPFAGKLRLAILTCWVLAGIALLILPLCCLRTKRQAAARAPSTNRVAGSPA